MCRCRLGGEFLVGADPVADEIRNVAADKQLAAPHAVDLECASALRGLIRAGKLPTDEGRRALDLLGLMGIRRFDRTSLMSRVWDLRENMWPYDAAHVALAELLDAELYTVDTKFSGVPGLACTIRTFT